jgi:hypothetical protein
MEDLIIYSPTYEEHLELLHEVFKTASDNNVGFNREKTSFANATGDFAGYRVTEDGFRPNPELTRAIREFPQPNNITDLRSFYGLCQQVGNFSNKIASTLSPLSPLLKKNLEWTWDPQHEAAFRLAREELANVQELAFYNLERATSLHVDASRLHGLGFILKQQDATTGKWHLIQAGSRFLSSAESRYAMIELECLAAAWAMKKCRPFLEGLPTFVLITDHRPLVPILNDYSLDKLDNPRLLRLRLQMTRFVFSTKWVPGKANLEADALSRAPTTRASKSDEMAEGPSTFRARIVS